MAREIEVRVQFQDDKEFNDWLEESTTYQCSSSQQDTYLEPQETPFMYNDAKGELQADKWLRIRTNNNEESILCLKSVHRNEFGEYLYSDESESTVSDRSAVFDLFKSLGYVSIIEVSKQRKEWVFKDFKIAKDYIENLGTFFEIEIHNEKLEYTEAVAEIHRLLKSIQSSEYIEVKGGYPQLLWSAASSSIN